MGRPYATSAESLLQTSCPGEYRRCKNIIQTSFDKFSNPAIYPSSNGFVRAVYAAYSNHHHLSIRPEDVWFAILTQLSFHVNAHAEELRSFFVAHQGRKKINVIEMGTINSVDIGQLAVRMTHEMEKHIVDQDLRKWTMPDFSTTEDKDRVTTAVIMMGAMQKYFSYGMTLLCGIPSVTLLGEKDDWIKMRHRLQKLPQLGREPEQFASLLTPVLDYFIRSFDDPTDPKVLTFWSKVAHQDSGFSGPTYMSGWITAFCFWDANGKCLYRPPTAHYARGCDIDGTLFHRVDTEDIPEAYVSVPVTVDDNGVEYKTRMVAGSVGIQAWSSGSPLDESQWQGYPNTPSSGSNVGLDSIQPVSGWWMYELVDGDENEDNSGKMETRAQLPRARDGIPIGA